MTTINEMSGSYRLPDNFNINKKSADASSISKTEALAQRTNEIFLDHVPEIVEFTLATWIFFPITFVVKTIMVYLDAKQQAKADIKLALATKRLNFLNEMNKKLKDPTVTDAELINSQIIAGGILLNHYYFKEKHLKLLYELIIDRQTSSESINDIKQWQTRKKISEEVFLSKQKFMANPKFLPGSAHPVTLEEINRAAPPPPPRIRGVADEAGSGSEDTLLGKEADEAGSGSEDSGLGEGADGAKSCSEDALSGEEAHEAGSGSEDTGLGSESDGPHLDCNHSVSWLF